MVATYRRGSPGHPAASGAPALRRRLLWRSGRRPADHRPSAHRVTRLGALVLTATAAVLVTAATAAAPASAATAGDPGVPPHVLLLGVTGLTWDDLSPSTTPQLWDLATHSSLGSVVVRGVYERECAADGWLTIGAGARTVAPRDERADGARLCREVPAPVRDGGGWQVPGWSTVVAENTDRYDPTFGVVADSLSQAGRCAVAAGPGAALMLADATGRVARYLPDASAVDSAVLQRCQVVGVDLGEVPPAPGTDDKLLLPSGAKPLAGSRDAALQALDGEVARLRAAMPPDGTLLLVSPADETATARLRVLTATGPTGTGSAYVPGLLTSTSTRHAGLLQLTDVTPMLLDAAQAPPTGPIVGTAPTVVATDVPLDDRVSTLLTYDQRAQVIDRFTFPINQALVLLVLVTFGGFAVARWLVLRRRRRLGTDDGRPTGLRRRLWVASLFLAAIPVSTYATNLVPWWRVATPPGTGRAPLGMLLLAFAIAVVLTLVTVLVPWLRQPFRAVAFLSGVTVVVLAVDVLTGSRLQLATVLGLSPIAGGRFYGFGNVAFSVFATCAVFLGIAVSAPLVRRGRRVVAAAILLAFGVAVALIDGWPAFGADFGGMIALVIGFGVFALLVTGRTSWRLVLVVVLGGLLFAFAISFVDYLRPPAARTHLGEFMASLLSGDAWPTIFRKLRASANSLTFSWAAPLIPVVWALLMWVVLRPRRWHAEAVLALDEAVPTFRHGLIVALLVAALGALVNDSGVIVTATMLGLGAPLAVAAAADGGRPDRPRPAPSTPPEPVLPAARS
jgi:hypothetical protein